MDDVRIEAEIFAFNRHVVRDYARREPNTDAFCRRFVCRRLDEGRAALERRRRLGIQPRARPARDARAWRNSRERGAD